MSRDLGDDVQSGWELPNGGHMTLRESMSRATAVAWDRPHNHPAFGGKFPLFCSFSAIPLFTPNIPPNWHFHNTTHYTVWTLLNITVYCSIANLHDLYGLHAQNSNSVFTCSIVLNSALSENARIRHYICTELMREIDRCARASVVHAIHDSILYCVYAHNV